MRAASLLPLVPLLAFGLGFGGAWLGARGGAAIGAASPARPAGLEQAWREHLAERPGEVRARLAAIPAREAVLPGVRDEIALLRALADRDAPAVARLAQAPGTPPAVAAGALRALARGLAPETERSAWAARFLRDHPRSWAAQDVARLVR